MGNEMERLLAKFDRRIPATPAAVEECERQLGIRLPGEYLEFLNLSNGGEGFIGKSAYVILWAVEELASMNQAYEVQKYLPGLLIFGSDGGGEAYGFDMRTPQWRVVQVPFVGMAWDLAQPLGDTFNAFLEQLYAIESPLKKYYFKCPHCGNDEEFGRPQENTSNVGCLLFILGGYLATLLFMNHMEHRVQCGKCGFIFRPPSLPVSPAVRLAQWIVFILALFFMGIILLSGNRDVSRVIPDFGFLRDIQTFIQANMKLVTVGFLLMNSLIFVLCLMVWIIGGIYGRIKTGKVYEIYPKHNQEKEDRDGDAPYDIQNKHEL